MLIISGQVQVLAKGFNSINLFTLGMRDAMYRNIMYKTAVYTFVNVNGTIDRQTHKNSNIIRKIDVARITLTVHETISNRLNEIQGLF